MTTFLIDHLDRFYHGFLLAFWAAPTMTQGRLLFASLTSAYIIVAVRFEERDLIGTFGDRYRAYRNNTPPPLLPRRLPRPMSEGRNNR